MKIKDFSLLSQRETLSLLRGTRLMGFGHPKVYSGANLKVSKMDPNDLVPPQRYVLSSSVDKVLEIRDAFRGFLDVFSLNGALLFWPEGSTEEDDPIPFLPPIIETYDDGAIICDGMHRVYAAKQLRRDINCIVIDNIPKEYPYYAYPVPGGWSNVEEIEEITEGYKKKDYRDPLNYKGLFRDFNAVFPGIQKSRPHKPISG